MSTTLEATSGERIPVYFLNEAENKPAILIEQTETEALLFIPGIPDTNSQVNWLLLREKMLSLPIWALKNF